MALKAGSVVVYTCVTAGYDTVRAAPPSKECAFVLITNARTERPSGWTVMPLPPGEGKGAMANRFAKMHPDLLFPEYEISVYVDGNVSILSDITPLARLAMEYGDIALFEHPLRRCVYLEAEECAAIGYDWWWKIRRQMRRYQADGYPRGHGLHEANVIIRRHGAETVRKLMNAWWSEYLNGVRRDQLSLNYLSWKMNIPIVGLGPSDARSEERYFCLREGHLAGPRIVTRMRGWVNRKLTRTTSSPLRSD